MFHLLTEFAAARLLGISTRQLQRLTEQHAIPHVELPDGSIRFDLRDVEAWAQSLKHPAEPLAATVPS